MNIRGRMDKKIITIDGNKFSDLDSFFDEIDSVLTKDLDWQPGHNFNALNDLLHGGFGVYEYEEPVKMIWKNFSKSRSDLGQEIADDIVTMIVGHKHIEFEKID